MQKLFSFFLACVMAITFSSCERLVSGGEEPTPTEDTTPTVQPSPIKGIWKCLLDGMPMTLDFGDKEVTYKCYIEMFNATAIYKGIYTIEANDITMEFNSLEKKNSSKIEYTSPDKMPKDAELKDENTIIYLDYTFKRQ